MTPRKPHRQTAADPAMAVIARTARKTYQSIFGRPKHQPNGPIPNSNRPRLVTVPAASTRRYKQGVPKQVGIKNGIVIHHSEMLSDVTMSNTFAASAQNVNPANSSMFPWLSGIAQSYEKYYFRKLRFRTCPEVGTQTPGRIGMYVDPDPTDAIPTTKQQASATEGFSSSAVWDECTYSTPTDILSRNKSYFVSSNSGGGTLQTQSLYDLGRLVTVTYGGSNTNAVEMWVDYEVELTVPTSSALSSVTPATSSAFVFWSNAYVFPASGWFGPDTTYFAAHSKGTLMSWYDTNTISFTSAFAGRMIMTNLSDDSICYPDEDPSTTAGILSGGVNSNIETAESTVSYCSIYTVNASPGDRIRFRPVTGVTPLCVSICFVPTA